jgi:hypothetical protein
MLARVRGKVNKVRFKECDGMGGGGIGDGVWDAVKEREGSNVTVDGKDFGEEIGGVDEAGKEDKTEE